MKQAALTLAALGLHVFPCVAGGKRPATSHGFKDATTDAAQIEAWWRQNPDYNIGVATGPVSGFWALDVDVCDGTPGQKTIDDLEMANGDLPITPAQITGRGGKHYLFKWSDGVRNRGKFAPGLDVRGDGGYILVAPSKLSGHGSYKWIFAPDLEFADAPGWLMAMIVKHAEPRPEHVAPQVTRPPSDGRASAWGEAAIRAICDEVATCPPGSQSDKLIRAATRIGSIAAGGSAQESWATESLIAAAMNMPNGDARDPWTAQVVTDVIRRGMAHGALDPTPPPPARDPPPKPARGKPTLRVVTQEKIDPETGEFLDDEPAKPAILTWKSKEWMNGHKWIWNDEEKLQPTALENMRLMIEFHPATTGMFRYDEWADAMMMMRGLPGDDRTNYPRELCDHDETAVAAWLNHQYLKGAINTVASVIREIAFRHAYNPMTDWLSALEWDGSPRLNDILPRHLGCADTPYTRMVGRKFFISAIARAMSPGCKVDTMLILEGDQGLRKSSYARAICGADWFTDQIGDITNKDSSQAIQGRWMIEVPEMDKFSKHEANSVKDFLARQEDRYRPPYGRNMINRPRRCVFIGTINPIEGAGYVRDPTGARRFWPVKCRKIDLNLARLEREQIWAEALERWRMGESWWIDEDEVSTVKSAQDDIIEYDVWEPRIEKWLFENTGYFTATQILSEAVGLELNRQDHRAKLRVASIMTKLGYKSVVKYVSGSTSRVYEVLR